MADEQASMARLTAIAEQTAANASVPSWDYYPGDDVRFLLAQIDTLRQDRDAARAALEEIAEMETASPYYLRSMARAALKAGR